MNDMHQHKINQLINLPESIQDRTYTQEEIISALESTHDLLQFNLERNLCLQTLCLISELNIEDQFTLSILDECYSASRIFHYRDMQKTINADHFQPYSSLVNDFAKSLYTLPSGTTLTKEQFELYYDIIENKRVVVSAPKSFGKSRIFKELLLNSDYKNVAIIIPTLALLSETFASIKSEESLSHLNIITNTKQEFIDGSNVVIFTPERMNTYLDVYKELKFDFFVMDEVYKIFNEEDERSHVFTDCLYHMKDRSPNFYLIGPYFDKFSERFLQETNSHFVQYKVNIVQQRVYDITDIKVGDEFIFEGGSIIKRVTPEINLRNLLKTLPDQSLIYTYRKDTCESRAKQLAKVLPDSKKEWCTELIDYISENISSKWSLISFLKKGCSFHHAGIPKYIQIEIVDAFNKGLIKNLFCTTTLIEGVNTAAKNVVITSSKKGTADLTGFDIKNIKGRAGRFGKHFVGNVFLLDTVPEDTNLPCIDFSYYDNENLTPEANISIKKKDLTEKQKLQRKNIELELNKEKIPLHIIRKNKFVSIERQLDLAKRLKDKKLRQNILFSGNLPKKEQLGEILDLIFENLFNEQERTSRSFTKGKLIRLTKYYVYKSPSIKELIKEWTDSKNPDTKIRNTFTLLASYFEFALPKYLATFEALFNHINSSQISLTYLITVLEFGYADDHCIALKEAGVPQSLISKVERWFKGCEDIEQIRRRLRMNPGLLDALSVFEQTMIQRYI